MLQKIRIVIADDQTLMKDGLQTILNLEEDMEVIGTAENGDQAIQITKELEPDLVLMDIKMPILNGIDATKRIRKEAPNTKILILTTFGEEDYIIDALVNGAIGFLLKDIPGDRLIQTIRDAVNGHFIMPLAIATKLAERISILSNTDEHLDETSFGQFHVTFTELEKKIIPLMINGKKNPEIARILCMSEGTIKNNISSIYNKIGTNDRARAIYILKKRMLLDL